MARAVWEDTVLAEGDDVVFVEGNCYFRREDIHWQHLKPSSQTTICGWKGTANYYDVEVDGKPNPGAAWYYANPKPAAQEIRDRVAFWKGVHVESTPAHHADEVSGECTIS
ncbi:MAG: DUF427 domain-containing protein [Bryobacteraceae bacterium]|jgi:uncharacterized protein (DUF427 family)